MNEQVKAEILKSFAYEMSIEEMSEIYGISKLELEKIKFENADEIKEIRKYYGMED